MSMQLRLLLVRLAIIITNATALQAAVGAVSSCRMKNSTSLHLFFTVVPLLARHSLEYLRGAPRATRATGHGHQFLSLFQWFRKCCQNPSPELALRRTERLPAFFRIIINCRTYFLYMPAKLSHALARQRAQLPSQPWITLVLAGSRLPCVAAFSKFYGLFSWGPAAVSDSPGDFAAGSAVPSRQY
jgi:hypothetical protein